MHPIVNIAIRAAQKAGDTIIRSLERPEKIKVQEKGPGDYVTHVDQQVEAEMIDIISRAYPDHDILAEESGTRERKNEFLWIIDPIDGTNNFLHGLPHFCISIAVQKEGRTEHGVIYDPIRGDLFTATRGRGATLNGHRTRVSKQTQLEGSLISSNVTFEHSEKMECYFASLRDIYGAHAALRRSGSAALDLAYIASGRLDAGFASGIKIWDIAAGTLIIREAGGIVTDLSGGEEHLQRGELIAGNAKIFKHLSRIVATHFKTST